MREIKYIVIHCTATPQTATVAGIQRYWREVLGWNSPGYHRLILTDGNIATLSPDWAVCNGVAGFNRNALHVSYIGGVDANGKPIDNRTEWQKDALYEVVKEWAAKYPTAKIMGHRDFSRDLNRDGVLQPSEWAKACPSFDVKEWCEQVGLKHNR
jgi:N-acetyl-anhydromuramyl-L-alanine amidase AmpD